MGRGPSLTSSLGSDSPGIWFNNSDIFAETLSKRKIDAERWACGETGLALPGILLLSHFAATFYFDPICQSRSWRFGIQGKHLSFLYTIHKSHKCHRWSWQDTLPSSLGNAVGVVELHVKSPFTEKGLTTVVGEGVKLERYPTPPHCTICWSTIRIVQWSESHKIVISRTSVAVANIGCSSLKGQTCVHPAWEFVG